MKGEAILFFNFKLETVMNNKQNTGVMNLINEVSKLSGEQNKSSNIMVRVSPDFRNLLDHCVKASGCKGYSDFIRKLVIVSTPNTYKGEL